MERTHRTVHDLARRVDVERCPRPDKIRYYSRRAAKLAARQIEGGGRKPANGVPIRAYLCACGAFHLGGKYNPNG